MKLTFSLAIGTGLLIASQTASALDVDVNINSGRRGPPHVVHPPPQRVVERVWVPERVVERTERVLVRPAHHRKIEERVLVEPARIKHVEERVLVRPERVEREWIPPVVDRVKLGPIYVNRTVREGYWRENRIAAEYRIVHRDIEIPARYETVTRRVEVPAQYRDEIRREVIPGYWEERVVTRQGPPVYVEPPRRSGIDIDIDIHKRK